MLGLATGSSPLAIYAALAAHVRDGSLDYEPGLRLRARRVRRHPGRAPGVVRVGDPTARSSSRSGSTPRGSRCPTAAPPTSSAACERYEGAIRAAGGVDLQILGIGANGHIGFNEPTSSFASRTRIKTLHRAHPGRQRPVLRRARRGPDPLPDPGARHDLGRARAAARGPGAAEGGGGRGRRRGSRHEHVPGVGPAAPPPRHRHGRRGGGRPTCSWPTTTAGPTRTSRPGSSSEPGPRPPVGRPTGQPPRAPTGSSSTRCQTVSAAPRSTASSPSSGSTSLTCSAGAVRAPASMARCTSSDTRG